MSADTRAGTPCAPTLEQDSFESRLFELLVAGDWRPAVALARDWYAAHCPRYRRDETELALGWIGTALIYWDQYRARTMLDARDRNYLTPSDAQEDFRKDIARKWANELGTYRRRFETIDTYRTAEEAVAVIAARIERRNSSHLDPAPVAVPVEVAEDDDDAAGVAVVDNPGAEHRVEPLYSGPYPADLETPN